MNPPVDYPVSDDPNSGSTQGPMTYAALIDRFASAQLITDDMIHSATLSIEAAQQLPDAAKPTPVDTALTARARPEEFIERLLKVIR